MPQCNHASLVLPYKEIRNRTKGFFRMDGTATKMGAAGDTQEGKGVFYILMGQWDTLQIPTAAQMHPLCCSLGQRPLGASSRVRAARLHPWRLVAICILSHCPISK